MSKAASRRRKPVKPPSSWLVPAVIARQGVGGSGMPTDASSKKPAARGSSVKKSKKTTRVKHPREVIISVRLDACLADTLQKLPNRSAFIREAVEQALGRCCPVCRGAGVNSETRLPSPEEASRPTESRTTSIRENIDYFTMNGGS